MQVQNIKRIPMPTQGEIANLPEEAGMLLNLFQQNLPIKDYKNFARVIVDTASGKLPSLRNAKLYYDNPVLVGTAQQIYSMAGEYNSDKIPISTYEKMRLHPQIALGSALIELPIIAQNFRIDCEDEKISAFVEEAFRPIYRDTIRNLLRSEQFGVAAGQKLYRTKKFKITIPKEDGGYKTLYDDWGLFIKQIKFAHPSSLTIHRDDDENIEYVQQKQTSTNMNPKKIHISRMVWHAPNSEYGNFFGSSRYKNAYQPWYFAQILTQFMLRYMERRGTPPIIVGAPPGFSVNTNHAQVDNLSLGLKIAQSLTSHSAASMPRQYDKNGNSLWDVSILKDDARGEMFIDALKYYNIQISRAMLIPEKVATADGSSTNATSESHVDVHLLHEEAITQYLEDTLNSQIVPDLVNYNFEESKRRTCLIKIERLNHSRRTLVQNVLQRMLMLSAGSLRDGIYPKYIPSLRKMLEFLEIPGESLDNVFLLPETTDSKDNTEDSNYPEDPDNEDVSEDDTENVDELEKEQKIKDRNRDATPRKERTRRDRRSKERL